MSTQLDDPKIFISYSWNPPQHKEKVIELAKRLQHDTVDVILDVWDLAPGQDKNLFMEQTVNNPAIKRVFLVCNKQYKEKADGRLGGVGTESLIMSKEIYAKADQTKFIPLVFEFDEQGEPYLPTFLHSRIFFDMRDNEHFEENYEQLLRNIFDKPTHKRPARGVRPTFLDDEQPNSLPTARRVTAIKTAFANERKNAPLLVKEYYQAFLQAVKGFEPEENEFTRTNSVELTLSKMEQMLPLRDDFISFLEVYCNATPTLDNDALYNFFEQYLQYFADNRVESVDEAISSVRWDYLRFFTYELLLYSVAALERHGQYDVLGEFLHSSFVVTPQYGKTEAQTFTSFGPYNYTLNKHHNAQFQGNRTSVVADKIKERAKGEYSFDSLKQADIILHVASVLHRGVNPNNHRGTWIWRPETSVYGTQRLPFFEKLISSRFFEKAKKVLGVDSPMELQQVFDDLQKDSYIRKFYNQLRWDYRGLPEIERLLHKENIATFK